jgi:C4-dicarboxylate-specific signal transduction histidine kinase
MHQMLINLIKNADEAMEKTDEAIHISWQAEKDRVLITLLDSGYGLTNDSNLFIPFYTTKSDGNGIGLVLCRQIAENHHGYLSLENRVDRTGCRVTLNLPLRSPA